jgi:hypothetical protein
MKGYYASGGASLPAERTVYFSKHKIIFFFLGAVLTFLDPDLECGVTGPAES